MTDSALDIERIVREVLRELRAGESAPAPDAGAAPAPVPRSEAVPPAQDAGRLVLEDRVVAMALLAERLSGVREVVVAPRAVVTPAVVDELRRRGVALVRATAAPRSSPRDASGVRVELWNVSRSFDASALSAMLRGAGHTVADHQAECLIETAKALAKEVRAGAALGIILTRHLAAAVCLANRHAGVRAVAAGDLAGLQSAADAVGANVVVLDSSRLSAFALKQLADAFCQRGVRPCPESLREALG